MSDVTRAVLLRDHVRSKVEGIQRLYARGAGERPLPSGSAALARLRRMDLGQPGDSPDSWGEVLEGMPERLVGGEDAQGSAQPSRAEAAAHAAIGLYALHQYSKGIPVHVRGDRPGRAFGALARARATGSEEFSGSVVSHIHAAAAAVSPEHRIQELRTLVQLLRTVGPPLGTMDYGLLARDLYDLSHPATGPRVRLAWGRDLHYRPQHNHDSVQGESA